jgi:hypothetical protein
MSRIETPYREGMSFPFPRAGDMPAADTALPGGDIRCPGSAAPRLGTTITPPFPDGYERIVAGMGCSFGAERLY